MSDVMSMPVLVPAPAGRGGELIDHLHRFGLTVDHSPFLELSMQRDSDTRDAVGALVEGRFDAVVLDSPRAADLLLSYEPVLPEHTLLIAVGHETAAALHAHGMDPAVVTADSPAALVSQAPAADESAQRLLLLGSATLAPAVREGLGAKGYTVTQVVAYRPRSVSLEPQIVRDLRLHGYSAIVLTSAMIATLAGHLGIHRDIRVVTIDAEATAAAEAKGLVVHGQAIEPTGASLAEATRRALAEQSG